MDNRLGLQLVISLFFLLLQYPRVNGATRDRACPQGQIIHKVPGPPYLACCYPTRCGTNEEVRPCTFNGTADVCQRCSGYYNQSVRTSSFTMEKCVSWPLNHKCFRMGENKVLHDKSDPKLRRCVCNIEKGYKYVPPESPGPHLEAYCQLMPRCEPGFEPVDNGSCKPCGENRFNSRRGYRLCQPKTNCELLGLETIFASPDATSDNNCSEPEPKPEPKTTKPTTTTTVSSTSTSTTPVVVPVGDRDHKGNPGASQEEEEEEEDEKKSLIWPIIGIVLFLLIVIIIIIIIFVYRRRRGMPCCGCDASKSLDADKYGPRSCQLSDFQKAESNGVPPYMASQLGRNEKLVNNNVNGGSRYMHTNPSYALQGHHNGSVVQFAGIDGAETGRSVALQPAVSVPPTTRQGILRNGNNRRLGNAYAQSRPAASPQDMSLDSIGQEKLHVSLDGLEANAELGENDPLLVAEERERQAAFPRGPDAQFRMRPPANPVCYVPVSSMPAHAHQARPIYRPSHSGSSSPPVQPVGSQATFVPSSNAVTFTRSTSVIASPEGEVEEEELEANVPRFSQILPEADASQPSLPSNPILRMMQERDPSRTDSRARGESTQQMRSPSDRLHTRPYPTSPAHYAGPPQGPRKAMGGPGMHNYAPALRGSSGPSSPEDSDPNHHIMDLKEQQLAESFRSSLDQAETRSKHVFESDTPPAGEDSDEVFTEGSGQTQIKTPDPSWEPKPKPGHHTPFKVADPNPPFFVLGSSGPPDRKRKNSSSSSRGDGLGDRRRNASGNAGKNSMERKRLSSSGSDQAALDRKRKPSGSGSQQNTLERPHPPSGDKPWPYFKSASSQDSADKRQRFGRAVSLEDREEAPHSPTKSQRLLEPLGDLPKPGGQTAGTDTGLSTLEAVFRKASRSVSEPAGEAIQSDSDEADKKASEGEDSESLELSSADSSQTGTHKSGLYTRSQSDGTSSSGESAPKPTPRSLSEDKPQRQDRPIAKVKPMPASDTSVNKVAMEGDSAADQAPLDDPSSSLDNSHSSLEGRPAEEVASSAENDANETRPKTPDVDQGTEPDVDQGAEPDNGFESEDEHSV